MHATLDIDMTCCVPAGLSLIRTDGLEGAVLGGDVTHPSRERSGGLGAMRSIVAETGDGFATFRSAVTL